MGRVAEQVDGIAISYADIPGFLSSTVPTHDGFLRIGEWCGRRVVVMQGRLHRYEGYSAADVVFPLRVMAALGAQLCLMTNAAGALNDRARVGDLVLIEDHLSMASLAGEDPTRFDYEPDLGERFTSLNGAYSRDIMELLEVKHRSVIGKVPEKGVYAYVTGPSFETAAEVRMLQSLGCDVVGMSTVPEVLAARQAGLKVGAISAVTNVCVSSVTENYVTNADDIFEALKSIAPRMEQLLAAVLPEL